MHGNLNRLYRSAKRIYSNIAVLAQPLGHEDQVCILKLDRSLKA